MNMDFPDFRRKLEDDLLKIEAAMVQADASAGTVVLDQSSVGRLSRMDALQQQAMATGMKARLVSRRLALQAALERIAAGTYGLCCQCEGAMEVERLGNDPAAVFCAECMNARELHGGRVGDA